MNLIINKGLHSYSITMSEQKKKTAKKVIESLDLPKDIFLGMPDIALSGNREVYISNHRGILSYGQEEMVILAKDYQIRIVGKHLNILSYSQEDLSIQGYITAMEFL